MMSSRIDLIIDENTNAYALWKPLLESKDSELQLLYSLSPLMSYCTIAIENCIIENKCLSIRKNYDFVKNLSLDFFKEEITPIILRTLVAELHSARSKNVLEAENSKMRFLEFIQLISSAAAIKIILNKYEELPRLLLTSIDQFVSEIQLFFFRLNNDIREIESTLGISSLSTYKLHKLKFSGDKHNQGKRVIVINFRKNHSEKLLVYKPRPLKLTTSLQYFFNWINENTKFALCLPKTVCKKDYGWQEFIDNESCKNKEDAVHFYYHLGGLLCVFHLLNSQDIHSENIIAFGKNPILIDCECLLTPVLQQNIDKPRIRNLVCSTLILPTRNMSDTEYSGFDNSVIGNIDEQLLPFTRFSWELEGTDSMRLKRAPSFLKPHKNRPKLDTKPINPLEYKDIFLSGFRELYNFFLTNLKKLKSNESPVNHFCNCLSRVIIRPTNQYSKLLIESYHPTLVHDKVKRHNHFSFLKESIKNSPEYKRFIQYELQSLEENNIPIFNINTSGINIYSNINKDTNIKALVSPIDHIKINLESFWGENDLEIQSTIIENSFETLSTLKNKSDLLPSYPEKKQSNEPSQENLKTKTIKMCDLIYSKLIRDFDYISWPCIIGAGSKLTQSITDYSLYNGLLGIVLTLGTAGYLYDIQVYTDLVVNAADFILNSINNGTQIFTNAGFYDGIGGAIYFLYYFSEVFPLINSDYVRSILKKSEELIFTTHSYDIMSGHAGLLLSLTKINGLVASKELTTYLNFSKNKLLDLLDSNESWSLSPSYAHGVTGIYYALQKLYKLTNDQGLVKSIKKCLAIEKLFFKKDIKNWNNKDKNLSGHSIAWCHGAVGIGFARLLLKNDLSRLDVANQYVIDTSVKLTKEYGFKTEACLCHGYSGSVDFLLEAQRHGLDVESEVYIERMLNKIDRNQLYFYKSNKFFVPGLLDGLSGVIYVLLRLAHKKVPSILMV